MHLSTYLKSLPFALLTIIELISHFKQKETTMDLNERRKPGIQFEFCQFCH